MIIYPATAAPGPPPTTALLLGSEQYYTTARSRPTETDPLATQPATEGVTSLPPLASRSWTEGPDPPRAALLQVASNPLYAPEEFTYSQEPEQLVESSFSQVGEVEGEVGVDGEVTSEALSGVEGGVEGEIEGVVEDEVEGGLGGQTNEIPVFSIKPRGQSMYKEQ